MKKELKEKKCKSCSETFKPFSSLAKVCSMACSLDYVGMQKLSKQNKDYAIKKREFLVNDKQFQRSKAQKAFNEFIRLRDANLGCISCDKPSDWGGQWHAGHYKTVGARPDLRFNEDNAHKQCSQCNNFLSGNLGRYRISLVAKIGEQIVSILDTDNGTQKKYTAIDYAAIHSKYSEKIKVIKNASKTM